MLNERGSGNYTFFVRALDPAGNVDLDTELQRNVYHWKFSPRVSMLLVLGVMLTFLLVCVVSWLEVKRRRRKKALERHAMKRMKRKFKNLEKKQSQVQGRGTTGGESRKSSAKNAAESSVRRRKEPRGKSQAREVRKQSQKPSSRADVEKLNLGKKKVSPTSEQKNIVNFDLPKKKRSGKKFL